MIIYPQIEANQVAGTFKENFIFFFFFKLAVFPLIILEWQDMIESSLE